MRLIIYSAILFFILLFFSLLTGCGSGEDQPSKIEQEPVTTKAEVEKKVVLSAEDYEKKTQQTEPPSVANNQLSIQEIADEIIIENQGYETDKRKPVNFSHKRHYEEYKITCVQCHHVYEDGNNVWKQGDPVEKCAFCHDPTEKQEGILKLQSAFHNNCRTCHSEISQEGKEAPHKKCTGCHS